MPSYRIQLTINNSVKKPKASTIVVANNYDTLVKLSCSKFKFNPKTQKIRFFVARITSNAKIGVEISNDEDFNRYIINDIMLAVSNGENFKGKSCLSDSYNSSLENKINRPPRHPFPLNEDINCNNLDSTLVSTLVSTPDNKKIVLNKNDFELNNQIHKNISYDKKTQGLFPIFNGTRL